MSLEYKTATWSCWMIRRNVWKLRFREWDRMEREGDGDGESVERRMMKGNGVTVWIMIIKGEVNGVKLRKMVF